MVNLHRCPTILTLFLIDILMIMLSVLEDRLYTGIENNNKEEPHRLGEC